MMRDDFCHVPIYSLPKSSFSEFMELYGKLEGILLDLSGKVVTLKSNSNINAPRLSHLTSEIKIANQLFLLDTKIQNKEEILHKLVQCLSELLISVQDEKSISRDNSELFQNTTSRLRGIYGECGIEFDKEESKKHTSKIQMKLSKNVLKSAYENAEEIRIRVGKASALTKGGSSDSLSSNKSRKSTKKKVTKEAQSISSEQQTSTTSLSLGKSAEEKLEEAKSFWRKNFPDLQEPVNWVELWHCLIEEYNKGYESSKEVLIRRKLDPRHDGKVTYQSFIDVVTELGSVKAMFRMKAKEVEQVQKSESAHSIPENERKTFPKVNDIYEACKIGDVDQVFTFISANPGDANKPDAQGRTPLFIACEHGHVDVLYKLLLQGCSINAIDFKHRTPLHVAALNGHKHVVKLLTMNHTNVYAQDLDGMTPLHMACSTPQGANAVKNILKRSHRLDIETNNGSTALHVACKGGYLKSVRQLIDKGANVHAENSSGWTPLHVACQYNRKKAARVLMENGKANIDAVNRFNGSTPLHLACQYQSLYCVKLLVELKANVNMADKNGLTAIFIACKCPNGEILETLMTREPNLSVDLADGYTPLMMVCDLGFTGNVRILLNQPTIDINARDNQGKTCLHVACAKNHIQIVKLLLTKVHIDVNAVDKKGDTPLHEACGRGYSEIVKMLLDHSAKVNVKNYEGNTCLHVAAQFGHCGIVDILVSLKVDVNAQNDHGFTVLLMACAHGHLDFVEHLLKHGANVNIQNFEGWTGLHFASSIGRMDIFRALLERSADPTLKTREGKTALEVAKKIQVNKTLLE